MKLLMIDDNQRNTFALSAVLKAKEYSTIIANNMVDTSPCCEMKKLALFF